MFQHADRCGRDFFPVLKSRGKRYTLYPACESCKDDRIQVCCNTFSRHECVFILLYHACNIAITIYLDTGTGKKRQLINVRENSKEFWKEWCKTLLGVYVFTGKDYVSAFKGKYKVTPVKRLMKYPKFHSAFSKLGEEWIVPGDVTKYLEEF